MPKQTIGEFLAIQRKARGLTQQEVADMLGISNKTLSSWESGRSYPDILTLPALAEIYGVTVDEILRGERAAGDGEAGEISERSQKKLLKNAANRYSVKCTTLTGIGIGGVGLFVLALCLGFVETWLLILFAVLSVLTEITVAILFVVFEKSALLAEEETSRYSLTVKHMTYQAAFRIVCAVCVPVLCAVFFMQRIANGSALSNGSTVSLVWLLSALFIALLSVVLLIWLSGRGREFYTAEEAAASSQNKKLAGKLLSVGGAIGIVLLIASFVLSSVAFTHTEKRLDRTEKDEFIRAIQTVELRKTDAGDYGISLESDGEYGDYFVDIQAALTRPVISGSSEKRGSAYHIEGDLYLRYLIDYESNSRCYVVYIPDLSGYSPDLSKQLEVSVFYGTVLFREMEQFRRNYPDPTAEDLLSGMERDEVFFVLDHDAAAVAEPSAVNGMGSYNYSSAYEIEVSGDRYTLFFRETRNYPFIAVIGWGGVLVTAIVCAFLYHKKRTAIFSSRP